MANGNRTNLIAGYVGVDIPEYIGKIHEQLYLGTCRWKMDENIHHDWWTCVKEITKFRQQTGTFFTKQLTTQISQILMTDKSRVVLYSCLRTPMDTFHGVDAFIVWWGSGRQESGRIVTLDITLKNEKEYRTDVLIPPQKLCNFRGLVQEVVGHLTKNPPKIYYNNNNQVQ